MIKYLCKGHIATLRYCNCNFAMMSWVGYSRSGSKSGVIHPLIDRQCASRFVTAKADVEKRVQV
jgi:hypothetical protein